MSERSSLTPHGAGFRFVDAVEWLAPNQVRAHVWLNPAWPWFADHFPGAPLMPGVLILEAAAQAAGALWGRHLGGEMRPFRLVQALDFRWTGEVRPDVQLISEVTLEREFGTMARFQVRTRVETGLVARGTLVLAR